jgi:hypothetical protein
MLEINLPTEFLSLHDQIHALKNQWHEYKVKVEAELTAQYVGKLVRFSNKGWNIGKITKVSFGLLLVARYSDHPDTPLKELITFRIGIPEKTYKYQQGEQGERAIGLNNITLLSDEEIVEYQRTREMHERINRRK